MNSDVIMILHLDAATKTVSILSIPRDLFVPNARSTGAYKVDAALAQGPSQLVAVVEEDFGIPIQHYVELNFDTFAAVITAFGGITMEFPDRIFDKYSGLHILQTGCHHLNGVQALQVVRARHLQYWVTGDSTTTPYTWPQEGQSDLARIVRDHEFLRVLAAKVKQHGLGSPGTDFSLLNSVVPDLTVDSGFSLSHMVNLALTFHTVDVNSAPQLTVPVLVDTFGTYIFGGSDFGDVEFPIQPLQRNVIDQFLGVSGDTNTMTGLPLPAPPSVTVSVLNGSGQTGQATQTATALGGLGFHVVGTGNTTVLATKTETFVTYSTPGDEAAAQAVADSLSGTVILDYGKTADGAQVTVTTGSDLSVDATAPSAATTTTTAPGAASHDVSHGASHGGASTSTTGAAAPATTSSTAVPTPTGFAPPSSSNPPLTSYDPRACAPGQKGNTGPW